MTYSLFESNRADVRPLSVFNLHVNATADGEAVPMLQNLIIPQQTIGFYHCGCAASHYNTSVCVCAHTSQAEYMCVVAVVYYWALPRSIKAPCRKLAAFVLRVCDLWSHEALML